MRKALGILFRVIAGYLVCLFTMTEFVGRLPANMKLGILMGVSLFAVVALLIALALIRFASWQRDTGIVLLGASGVLVFTIFSCACFLMDETFRKMMPLDPLALFDDYWTGCGVMAGFAALGWILARTDRGKTGRGAAREKGSAAPPANTSEQ